VEASATAKLSVDFEDVSESYSGAMKFNGKYIYDENLYLNARLTAIDPPKGSVNLNYSISNGYVLSVSRGSKGMKFEMKLTAGVKFNQTLSSDSIDDLEGMLDDKVNITLTIKVYDNGTTTPKYVKTFTDLEEASEYLGNTILDNIGQL